MIAVVVLMVLRGVGADGEKREWLWSWMMRRSGVDEDEIGTLVASGDALDVIFAGRVTDWLWEKKLWCLRAVDREEDEQWDDDGETDFVDASKEGIGGLWRRGVEVNGLCVVLWRMRVSIEKGVNLALERSGMQGLYD